MPLDRPGRGAWWTHPFDTLDGQRFLITRGARPPGEFQVLLDWSVTLPD
jgi:hypothetical protein